MMKYFLLIFLSVVSFCLTDPEMISGKELTVVYTANTNGKLRACNCPHDKYGGLSERVTLIKRLRQKEKDFLLVDGGNMVSLWGSFDEKASHIMHIMNLMEYDAAGAGAYEMFYGVESVQKMSSEAKFPLISTTIVKNSDGATVVQPFTTIRIGNINTGILSVCDSTSLLAVGSPKVKDYHFLSLPGIMKQTLQKISSQTDFIVVLSQLSPDENTKLLEHFPDIDLIIQTYGNKITNPPVVTPHGIIASPCSRGQFVGLIKLRRSDD